jgi:hypothetical protein
LYLLSKKKYEIISYFSTITKPREDVIFPQPDWDTLIPWDLIGLGLSFGIIGYSMLNRRPKIKKINILFTLDKYYSNTMWNDNHFIIYIYIFSKNYFKYIILQQAYGYTNRLAVEFISFARTFLRENISNPLSHLPRPIPETLPDINYTICGPCKYRGRTYFGIGFNENWRMRR